MGHQKKYGQHSKLPNYLKLSYWCVSNIENLVGYFVGIFLLIPEITVCAVIRTISTFIAHTKIMSNVSVHGLDLNQDGEAMLFIILSHRIKFLTP